MRHVEGLTLSLGFDLRLSTRAWARLVDAAIEEDVCHDESDAQERGEDASVGH
jgi:hypothetical protein